MGHVSVCENCMGQWDNFIDQEVALEGCMWDWDSTCMKIQGPRSGLRVCVCM